MDKILDGVRRFRDTVFAEQRSLFERLARKQDPQALFITCSDSRINPNLITSTEPGDLFILRNAGNIIPPYGAANGGEGATIEYAIAVLGVRHIIVCGHSHCGAMQALLTPAATIWNGPNISFYHSQANGLQDQIRDPIRTQLARFLKHELLAQRREQRALPQPQPVPSSDRHRH